MAKEAEQLAEQAQRIADLREKKSREEGRHIAQPEVAEAVGISLRGYQDWEAGRIDPKRQNLKALADYHGVTTDFIEFGVEQRPRGAAPDLLGSLEGPQLTHIEQALEKLLNRMAGLEEALQLEAGRAAAHDAEVLRRLEEGR